MKMRSLSKAACVNDAAKSDQQWYMETMYKSTRIQSSHLNFSERKSWKPENVLLLKNNMNQLFPEDSIPENLIDTINKIKSEKVRY